MQHVRKNVNKE